MDAPPKRIVSLVPSITEFLIDIGLESNLVGRTQFCIHPKEQLADVPIVGGTKNVDITKVLALKPDLIIAVKEENEQLQVEHLSEHVPCLVFDIVDVHSAFNMMKVIAQATETTSEVTAIIKTINKALLQMDKKAQKSAVYLIWHKPMMSINSRTFISDMMQYAGFYNLFSDKKESYPLITTDEILKLNPAYILLSSEPFKFTEKHKAFYQNKYPNSKVILVDGEMFSWYGSRMIKAFKYFSNCF